MTETVQFVAADGTVLGLNGPTYTLLDRIGWWAPPQRLYTEALPGVAGSRRIGTVIRERSVGVSVAVKAASWDALQALLTTTLAAFRQGGYFESAVNGRTRRLGVAYSSSAETPARVGTTWATVAPTFTAPDPYWYDPAEQQGAINLAGAVAGLRFPLRVPLFGGVPNSAAQGLLVAGSAPTPWRMTVLGPLTRLILLKSATGEVLDLTYTVPSGQQVLIDTAVGARKVVLDTGQTQEAISHLLSSVSTFWWLEAGANPVVARVQGGSGTQVVFRWNNRDWTPG